MCRLYGLYATHPTRASCALRKSQNDLIDAGATTRSGSVPSIDGWGVCVSSRSGVQCRRQVQPARKSRRSREDALSTPGTSLISHVRVEPGGTPSVAGTQPFYDQESTFAHCGAIDAFDRFRDDLLDALPPNRRRAIRGETNSEHLFQLLLERHHQVSDRSRSGSLRAVLKNLTRWSTAVDPRASVEASILWTINGLLTAARYDFPLYVLERTSPLLCSICGHPHARPSSGNYRCVTFASQPLTDEDWREVPNRSVASVDAEASVTITPFEDIQPVSWLKTGT